MANHLIDAGIVLILIGFLLVFIGSILNTQKSSNIQWGFGGFIGPIPFGFASNKNMLYITFIVSLTLFIVLLLYNMGFK